MAKIFSLLKLNKKGFAPGAKPFFIEVNVNYIIPPIPPPP